MNFYIDFEATQFSGHIISIGCVSGNGQQFKRFVRPPEGEKITSFITNLTGITDKMLAEAPTADDAFVDLMNFIGSNSDEQPPKYFCYGENDAGFITKTMKYMTNPYACMMAQAMSANLIDYSKEVKAFFVTPNRIALRKVYNLLKEEEDNQKHDALEDALMLAEIVNKMKDKCRPEDGVILAAMPKSVKPNVKRAPQMFLEWPNNMWEADTKGTYSNWQIMAKNDNGDVKYFDSLNTATLWAIKYITRGYSPKKQGDIDTVANTIMGRIQSGKPYCNFKWYSWTQANRMEENNVK